jgi:hypothetical protein
MGTPCVLDPRNAAHRDNARNCFGRNSFCMSVGVWAAGYRQARSDGLRNHGGSFRRRFISDVVADGVTGSLMHYDPDGCQDRLAEAVNAIVDDPGKAKHYG